MQFEKTGATTCRIFPYWGKARAASEIHTETAARSHADWTALLSGRTLATHGSCRSPIRSDMNSNLYTWPARLLTAAVCLLSQRRPLEKVSSTHFQSYASERVQQILENAVHAMTHPGYADMIRTVVRCERSVFDSNLKSDWSGVGSGRADPSRLQHVLTHRQFGRDVMCRGRPPALSATLSRAQRRQIH